jgi:hypothetical protein
MNSEDKKKKPEDNVWQRFAEVLKEYPEDIFKNLPKDLAENHDKYLYGDKKEKLK